MNLHEDKKLFRNAVQATSEFKEIREVYIEKDYWVTYALKTIFSSPAGKDAIFKGGTALSKCFNLIERFSEDIDLVVLRNKGETNTQMTRKIRAISNALSEALPEVEIEGITRKRGMNRKTAHTYIKEFSGEYGQVRDTIIVEASWFGSHEPNTKHHLSTYINEMMEANDQAEMAEQYGLLPFEVQVLAIRRTLCEKIMSLVRFSHSDNPIAELGNKIRHTYDIHLMLKNEEIRMFFESPDFDAFLKTVAHDDVASYKSGNKWLVNHPKEAIIFRDLDRVWDKLKNNYEQDFQYLVFGELPKQEHIYDSLSEITARLKDVKWDIKPTDIT
ncbi:MAG: nucleotidyl transferase AbiEii/AbiGii toxin family protein [Balneolaceae bacterium]